MNIVNLALANIRRGKGAAISLFILIFIAGLLLNIGLTVIFKINTFYEDKVEELHDAHLSIVRERADYTEDQGSFLHAYPGVKEAETENFLLMSTAKFRYGDSDLSIGTALLNADANRTIAPMKLIEKLEPAKSDDIYISYSFKSSGGYKLGDSFTITYLDKEYHYRVAGFFEATMMGTNNMSMMKFFLPESAYLQLSGELVEKAGGTLISAIFADSAISSRLLDDYNKQFPHPAVGTSVPFFWAADLEMMQSAMMTINIIAMILVAFAAVIVLVSLIVIKFRVTNSINDGIVNIGVLQATGYTNGQILTSITLQFVLITLAAGIAGAAGSYAIMPVFGGIVSSLTGLLWSYSFDASLNLASVLILALSVLAVTLLSTLRIRRLHPVAALRGGIMTHSFNKNFFPLEKTGGGLHFMLACKTMMASRRQNLMIAAIFAAVTFASVFSVVLYYNIAADKTAFLNLVGAETSNVMVMAKPGTDSKMLTANIDQMDGVSKTSLLDMITVRIDDQPFYTNISDDYSKLNNNNVYEGRYPQFDNEIALSWMVAKRLHKNIGDTVNVEADGKSYSFLVSGLSQSINNLGQITSLTLTGIQHLIPDYAITTINVYLKGIDNESFMQSLKARYGNQTEDITDVDEMLGSQSGIYISAVFAIMIMILAITVLVVTLILYLVIKAMIYKRKREFGIMKATGYTAFQLMTQIALGYVPVVIAGVITGGVLGGLYTNTVLSLLLSGAGIHNVQFVVNIPLTVALCIGLAVLAYLVSMLVSFRIRRITAYSLFTE